MKVSEPRAADASAPPAWSGSFSLTKNKSKLQFAHLAPVLLLAVIAVGCRIEALKVGLLADDLDCLQYIYRIFHGEPLLFFERMVSPWQEPHIQLMYRPFADVSLCLDYAFWRANGVGYHLTNLLFHAVSVISLYLLSVHVFAGRGFGKSSDLCDAADVRTNDDGRLPAFLTALLFCVSPLWTEPVVWVAGRMDVMCGAFSLASLALYLKSLTSSSKRTARVLSTFAVAGYALALLSKEVAILFPLILFVSGFFSSRTSLSELRKNWTCCKQLLWSLAPFVALDASFLVLRTVVLGTFPGGYVGTYGKGLSETIFSRLFHRQSLERIAMPLHEDLFPIHSLHAALLKAVYMVSAVLVAARIPFLPWNGTTLRIIAWSLLCTAITFLPCLQIYTVNGSLSGSRVLYLPGAFASVAVIACLYPLVEGKAGTVRRIFRAASVSLVLAMAMLFGSASYRMVDVWIRATETLNCLRKEVQEAVASLGPERKLVVMNLPGEEQGAYQLFRFSELQVLVGPAFCKPECAGSLASPDLYPVLAPTSCNRLSRLLADSHYCVRWFDPVSRTLLPIMVPSPSEVSAKQGVTLKRLDSPDQEDDAQYLAMISPMNDMFAGSILRMDLSLKGAGYSAGYLTRLDVDAARGKSEPPTKGECTAIFADGVSRSIYLPLSDISQRLPGPGEGFRVLLKLPGAGYTHEIKNVGIIGPTEITAIRPDEKLFCEMPDSVCRFKNGRGGVLVDASRIPLARGVLLEVAGPGVLFNFSRVECTRAQQVRQATAHVVRSLKFTHELKERDFVRGRYQIRARAVDDKGRLIGVFSDPVTFLAHCDN
ncbi:MAG: hypothetical protein K2W95_06465 [Candidatus Obscuribacterales bacterium]|nr:hypothetical protein [Candidatus Obscuribacterales bacterium]